MNKQNLIKYTLLKVFSRICFVGAGRSWLVWDNHVPSDVTVKLHGLKPTYSLGQIMILQVSNISMNLMHAQYFYLLLYLF